MATEEEIYAIIMKVENEEKVKTLSKSLEEAEQKLRDLVPKCRRRHEQIGEGLGGEVAKFSAQLKAAQSEMGMSANKVLQLGRTFDDLQYVPEQGLRPIINNVMELSPALGMAMIAVQLLITHWDELLAAFGKSKVKTQAEEMEELADKISKTADETARLHQLEERRQNAKAQEHGKTEDQKHQEDTVNKAFVYNGYGNSRQAVMDATGLGAAKAVDQNLLDEQKKAQKEFAGALDVAARSPQWANDARDAVGTGLASYQKKLNDVNQRVTDARNDPVTNRMADVATDPAKLQELINALERKGGQDDLVAKLKQATPAGHQAQLDKDAEDERIFKESGESGKEAHDRLQKIRKQQKEHTADAVSRVGPSINDKLQANLYDQMKTGVDPEFAMNDERDGVVAALKARGVGDDVVQGAAQKILDKAKEAVLNDIANGKKPALVEKEDAHQKKISDAFEQYQGKIGDLYEAASKAKQSQVIDSAGLANSIQASVGAKDPQLKMVEELMKANESLTKILNKPENLALMGP